MNYINIVNSVRILVYISVACTLITVLVAKTKFAGSVKYVCGISLLLTIITILSPFLKTMGSLINIDFSVTEDEEQANVSDEILINQSASFICEYVKTLLSQKYSIASENISVSVTLDDSNKENILIKNSLMVTKGYR